MPDRSQPPPSSEAENLFARWLAGRTSGENPDFEALCRAHPGDEIELRALLVDWALREGLPGKARAEAATEAPPSFAERVQQKYGSLVDPGISLDAAEKERGELPSSALLKRLSEHTLKQTRYKLQGELARGGMGAILRIWDEDLRRTLAMKVILGKEEVQPSEGTPPVDSRELARFLEEAQVTGQLDHPGIVPVHELGLDSDGRVYFTMKLVKGRDLKTILDLVFDELEGWNETRALSVILKVCEAMAYAHAKGVIHRDLKPANVMVGNYGEVFVMDWGLARVLGHKDAHDLRLQTEGFPTTSVKTERREEREGTPDSPLVTMDGDIVGTPAYMPPEQARGELEKLGPHSDVYALGAMLYHLLAEQMPYVAPGARVNNHMVLRWVQEGPPKPLSELRQDIPAELTAIVERAMERDGKQRYRDTLALADDLRAYLEHRVVKAYQTGAFAELRKWVERNKGLAAASAAAALALVAGLVASLVLKAQSDQNAKLAQENAEIAKKNEGQAQLEKERAESNEKRATKNEELAKQNEATAREEKERADREAEAATKRADEVLRLSALQDLDDLGAEANRLWPATPEMVPRYEKWLARAQEVVGELPGHEAKLADLRAKAVPWTAEQAAEERAKHPKLGELEQAERELGYLRKQQALLDSTEVAKDPSPEQVGVDLASLPTTADGVNSLAWPQVDPERTDFGGEAQGLVLARRAVELAAALAPSERASIRDTLAWALFANGRFDDAVAEEEQALEEAGSERAQEFQGLLDRLQKSIEERISPEGLEKEAKHVAELEARVAELEAEMSRRPEWNFTDTQDKWWHNQLTKLVDGLKIFSDSEKGLFSSGTSPEYGWGVKKRLEFAQAIQERSVSGSESAAQWSEAIASIRNKTECPLYDGLALTPQLGLLPIGRDPDSGLWEFAHLQTGNPAERGPDGKLILKEETGLVFVLIPGGTFWMGAQKSDPKGRNYDPQADDNSGPVHAVTLPPFFLSKYELTQGQWSRFLGKNPSQYGPTWNFGGKQHNLEHPVEQVSWEDCTETLGRLGLDLPTEAQWEYGARAGTSTVWWTGDEARSLQGAANLADSFSKKNGGASAWVYEDWLDDGYVAHAPMGTYRPNGFGLHDVHGNVWEWCRDGYGGYRTKVRPGDGERLVEAPRNRVYRGGGFGDAAVLARSADRLYGSPVIRINGLGARPARRISTP